MKLKIAVRLFFILCIIACGTILTAAEVPVPAAQPVQAEKPQTAGSKMTSALAPVELSAVSAKEEKVVLGKLYGSCQRTDDKTIYKFQVELTSLGASVSGVTLSEFTNLDPASPQPLKLLSPVISGKTIYSLACESLYAAREGQPFAGLAFPLDKLQWRLAEQKVDKAVFVAELGETKPSGEGFNRISNPILRITRTFQVLPGSYDLITDTQFENLSSESLRVQMNMSGPAGIHHEGQQRDTLNVYAAFTNPKGEVVSQLRDSASMKKAVDKGKPDKLKIEAPNDQSPFLWAGLTNKYFAAIVYPSTELSMGQTEFLTARYYPDRVGVRHSETMSYLIKTKTLELSPAGTQKASVSLAMNVYLGPKDKQVFQDNPVYNKLSFFQIISMMSCCCPQWMIGPMAFFLVWLMNTMYHWMGPLGNYGIVIMILVALVRLMLHPLTKSGQVQMMKAQKLMPKFQELQKRMGQNKTKMDPEMMEMNKAMMRAQSMGMLPMFIQMPIWIAVWTAVTINFDLRGQGFLSFWMTDLSGPDALIRFRPFEVPFIGTEISSFNLLPFLMGLAMYFQMKLTPTSQTTAQTNPEMAQQQKIMSVMMVAMFPIMLYNGPAGVNLYIMSSMAAGVVEQYVIRKHIKERQEQEEETLVPTTAKLSKPKKKKAKPFFRFDK